ncbi:MAG: Zn-ribbon domain-containing OB-fold protein [Acidimicrobiia bacterium]
MTTPTSAQAQQWWDAAEAGTLLVQRCSACSQSQHYPRSLCTNCGSDQVEFVESRGSGHVVSWTTVHRSPDPDRFPPPYTVALVELDEGVRLMSRLSADDAQCDARVSLAWETVDGKNIPTFVTEGNG